MAQLELIKRLATSTGSSKQLVAAVTGKKIRVLSMVLNRHGGTTVTVSIRTNNGSGTRILYDVGISDDTSLVLPFTDEGWFETASGEALYLQQASTANGTISVTLSYQEI